MGGAASNLLEGKVQMWKESGVHGGIRQEESVRRVIRRARKQQGVERMSKREAGSLVLVRRWRGSQNEGWRWMFQVR